MRKILFAILAVVLLIFTGVIIYRGTNLGKFEVWGIKQINEENDTIDQVNSDLGTLVNISYPEELSKLTNSGEVMEETKKEYEEQVTMLSSSKYYMQTEKYKLEFLWTKIGNYAKDNKVTPKMQVSSGSTNDVYNLTITAVGQYKNIAAFIYAIENDSKLGFKIEDFKMVRSTDGYVEGTFTCKDIRIDLKSIDNDTADGDEKDETVQKNTTNANKTTDTNKTANSETKNTTNINKTNANSTDTNNTAKTENSAVEEDIPEDTENASNTTT